MADPTITRIAVGVTPPLSPEVEYFSDKEISLNITNLSADTVVIEDVTLQFQADTGSAAIYVDHACGVELPATELAAVSIRVRPTARYLENTNVFQVMVHYRSHTAGRLGQRTGELHNGSYLIVRRPKDVIGDVFISFKQPEYVALARVLERYSRRAGLNPYLILDDKQPGGRHWQRIEEAIKRSRTAFVLWGERTEWGTGVQREVQMCRQYGVPEILLLEQHLSVPELFEATAMELEYSRFATDDPADSFAAAVTAVRNRLSR